MKFKVWDKQRKRFLTEEELWGRYFYTGEFDKDGNENIEYFQVNLSTGLLQREFDIALCDDIECCGSPDLVWTDTDRFIIRYY